MGHPDRRPTPPGSPMTNQVPETRDQESPRDCTGSAVPGAWGHCSGLKMQQNAAFFSVLPGLPQLVQRGLLRPRPRSAAQQHVSSRRRRLPSSRRYRRSPPCVTPQDRNTNS
ncbi:hypothetical protein NHX12_031773 [Muraenolepis orangiensis]|uniref:Uncharacterized protein n=1 Tax=Muraenolepis orangiensis TaxID=630683 RepID=A0A9Q0E838_9TELE|nr:hypothetical protein NHX12_031773 [Muraenolepis orangiensis]